MIKLYGFGSAFGLIDASPFVTKIDLTLRVANIEHEIITKQSNLGKAPKGKLPFIDDNGKIIADSLFIVEHLKSQHSVDLDNWLNQEQKAIAQLVGKSLDENFYWCLVYSRWISDDTWPIVRERFFGKLPFPLNKIIPFFVRRGVQKQINAHGMGMHSKQEITHIARLTLNSLSTLLGDKKYFFGEQISNLDVTAYAMLSSFTMSSIDNEMNNVVAEYKNLLSFTRAIKKRYYPEFNT